MVPKKPDEWGESCGTFTQWNTTGPAIKKGNLTFCDSMDEPGKYYTRWNKPSEKDKYHMISLIHGI